MRKIITVLAAVLLAVLVAGPAVATGHSVQQTRSFSVEHGDGSASGSYARTADEDLQLDGTLQVSGSGCYSTWVQKTRDFHVFPAERVGYRCGAGSTGFSSLQDLSVSQTWNVYIWVCRGGQNQDCGEQQTLLLYS